MSSAASSVRRSSPRSGLDLVGYAALAALVAWWTWRAWHDPLTLDTGLAYHAGTLAWATGHPERLPSWDGMPFLVATMAVVGRVLSERSSTDLDILLNTAAAVTAATIFLVRARRLLAPGWWWAAAFALLSFGPLMSSVWWKQFNLIALGLAVGGFDLARRRRPAAAALAIGLSISIKPLVFLLPLAMLARRDTRRVAAGAIAWVIGLDLAAQALLALRAHSLAVFNPLTGARNLIDKTSSAGNIFLCHPINFAPTQLLCRLDGGFQHWTLLRLAAVALVALLGLWVIDALRGRHALSWEVLAFTCPLSVMLSALAWTHYQIMLAPLFLLLLFRFSREGASPGAWAGLAAAYVLASLMWEPYGTIVSAIRGVPETTLHISLTEVLAQFAQYVVVVTGVIWYARRRAVPPAEETAVADGGRSESGAPSPPRELTLP